MIEEGDEDAQNNKGGLQGSMNQVQIYKRKTNRAKNEE